MLEKTALTPREREVLTCVASGMGCKASAQALKISLHTVKKHRGNVLRKLGLHNATELTRYALAQGLTELKRYPGRNRLRRL